MSFIETLSGESDKSGVNGEAEREGLAVGESEDIWEKKTGGLSD